ncbi:protein kinase domain-containing protein [Streptomyces meridianus]|uniref:non-specific serine/threonine protein kinase n=1 Tax=Streptomyces meridianus TaxID=2938945 RepID=A0ABT0X675_9ACTN|nr:protein kinase [Streptomyces meridianus]MCM2578038.1 protein kinase [Streptomyces meridianus]
MSHDGARGRYAGGSLAGGRYQLRDLLGEGGMASVHLAYDSVLDRQVAIKTLHTELGREQSFRERFRREAQSVAKLTHTNIVSVFDTGEDVLAGVTGAGEGAPMPYIVMEYVEGRPLRAVLDADIAEHGAMPTDKALKITGDVLAALEISHEMGLVHRDIKPGNVMMTKRNVVKVMDFGIARAMQSGVTSMTQTGMVVGTPQYLSPEQALGRAVDARSDLYSVGIMLFELLTGQLPFDADSPLAIAYAHVQQEPVAPSTINRSVPPGVDALVARALKKNPNERFPTAEAMRDECARVGGTDRSAASPIIISGGPAARSGSGSAVGATVFPPVDQQPPMPHGVQAPYQPQSHSGQVGGYAASTPPPPSQQMGQGGFAPSGPVVIGPTPPPYGSNPGSGGRSNTPLIVGAVLAVLVVLIVVIAAVSSSKGSEDDPIAGETGTPAPTATADDEPADPPSAPTATNSDGSTKALIPPDRSRTIEKRVCTEARPHYDDKSKIRLPDFQFKDIESVKSCIKAAGWKYRTTSKNDGIWGQGTVLGQNFDDYDEPFDPEKDTIKLTVASGYAD